MRSWMETQPGGAANPPPLRRRNSPQLRHKRPRYPLKRMLPAYALEKGGYKKDKGAEKSHLPPGHTGGRPGLPPLRLGEHSGMAFSHSSARSAAPTVGGAFHFFLDGCMVCLPPTVGGSIRAPMWYNRIRIWRRCLLLQGSDRNGFQGSYGKCQKMSG